MKIFLFFTPEKMGREEEKWVEGDGTHLYNNMGGMSKGSPPPAFI